MKTKTDIKNLPFLFDKNPDKGLAKKISAAGYPSMRDAVVSYYLMRGVMISLFLFAVFIIFLIKPNVHPVLMGVILFVLFIFCYQFVDMLMEREIKQQTERRHQFLPHFLRFMALYIQSGFSVDRSLGEMSEDIKPFYPLFTRLLQRCGLSLQSNPAREGAWQAIIEQVDIDNFTVIGDRLQTREAHGYKMTEVLHHFSEEIYQDLEHRESIKRERIPVTITFVSILCFLVPMIILMGSIVYFKLMEVMSTFSGMI